MTTPPISAPVYEVVKAGEGYAVHRNGKPLKSPAGNPFVVPVLPLAEAIAGEWRAQKPKPNTATMPLMQLASTTIDIIRKDRNGAVDQVANFAQSELLCHRAEQPDELIELQQKTWQPVLDWCAQRFDAVLKTGQGIMPITQSSEAVTAFRRAVEAYDDFRLAGLKQAVEVSGSIVLGLALIEKHLAAEQVFEAAELDGSFQIKKWGEDPATAKRREFIRHDLAACEKWFELLKA